MGFMSSFICALMTTNAKCQRWKTKRGGCKRSERQLRRRRPRFLRTKNVLPPNPNPQVCMDPSGSQFRSNFWPLFGQSSLKRPFYTLHWFQWQWGTSLVVWRQWWRVWWRRWGGRAVGGFLPLQSPPRSSLVPRLLRTLKPSSKERKMQNSRKWRRKSEWSFSDEI